MWDPPDSTTNCTRGTSRDIPCGILQTQRLTARMGRPGTSLLRTVYYLTAYVGRPMWDVPVCMGSSGHVCDGMSQDCPCPPCMVGDVYINGGRLSWDALYVLGHPKYCPPKRRQHWTSLVCLSVYSESGRSDGKQSVAIRSWFRARHRAFIVTGFN